MPQSQYALRFLSGVFEGRAVLLPANTALVIGRTDDADLAIDDHKLSRRHACITTRAGEVEIEDLGSRNGTFINGQRVEKSKLKSGDRVLIGASTLRLIPATGPTQNLPPPPPTLPQSRKQFTGRATDTQPTHRTD